MAERLYTGFHAVEERIRSVQEKAKENSGMRIFYSKPGPRIKKILAAAAEGENCSKNWNLMCSMRQRKT